ncbi:MAG: HesB/IscA family protein [Candidatus Melainabacteria bacterium]
MTIPSNTPTDQLVDITEAAATKLKAAITAPHNGIRLSVVGGGCAGLSYDIKPATGPDDADLVQESHGVRFFIHPMVLPYLKGTQLDYVDSLMDGGFKFHNPNAASSCGCGTSFGV